MVERVRDRLLVLASVAVTVASVAYVARVGGALVRSAAAAGQGGAQLELYATANLAEGRLLFTNRTAVPLHACAKAALTNAATRARLESVVVCSGEVQPYATVVLPAPYQGRSPDAVCPAEGGGIVDWSRCTLDVVDVTAR